MRRNRYLAASLVHIAICLCSCANDAKLSPPAAEVLSERERRVLDAAVPGALTERAQADLCDMVDRSERARQAVVSLLKAEDSLMTAGVLLRAASRAGPAIVPNIVHALETTDDGKGAESLLMALGRLGKEAHRAVPTVRVRLRDKSLSPEARATTLVVLCSIGACSAESLAELHRILDRHDNATTAALNAMAVGGNVDWVNDETVRLLVQGIRLHPGDDESIAGAATIAMVMRAAAPAVVAAVREAFDDAYRRERSTTALWYGLCLARLDSARQEDWMRRGLRRLGVNGITGKPLMATYLFAPPLVSKEMRRAAVRLLDDQDVAVVEGAACLLRSLGGPAPDAAGKLLAIAKTHPDPDARDCAMMALVHLLPHPELQRLRASLTADAVASSGLIETIDAWDTITRSRAPY